MGFDRNFILDVYFKEVRSLLEYCTPVWNGGLTKKDSIKIERVQKSFLKILIQGQYSSYTETCEEFGIQKLFQRREKLCLRFGKRELAKSNPLFHKCSKKPQRNARKNVVMVPTSRTVRHSRSSVPYISQLINKYYANK